MEPSRVPDVFHQLYANLSGYETAQQEKNRLGWTDQSTTYGEVLPESFLELMNEVKPAEGEVFIDLGSGTGKATFLAALSFPFRQVVGIELLPGLGELARKQLSRYEAEFRPRLPPQHPQQRIEFIDGDFLEQDLSSADVLFAHATCFSPELVALLARKLEELKPGARAIIAGQTIASPALQFRSMKIMKADWGTALTAIYQRV